MRTLLILVGLVLDGCAGTPMTYEQRQAFYAASVGLQNVGAQMQYDALAYQPKYIAPYNPAYSPVFNPVPITSANPYGVRR